MTIENVSGSAVARARSEDGALELSIAAEGSRLRVTVRNVAGTALTVCGHVDAETGRHHDWFVVRLAGAEGEPRTLAFFADRNMSALGLVDLAPGQDVSYLLHVVGWATMPVNGGLPLAPDSYQVTLIYQVPPDGLGWSGRIEVGPVVLVVPDLARDP